MAAAAFTYFFQGWLTRQESLLQELESPIDNQEIIQRVLTHYQEFYFEKAKIANEDIFLLLSPPWLTSFERSLLWISAFRPSSLFPLIETSELSNDLQSRINTVKAETRRKERDIMQAMARVQESVAEPPLYNLIRNFDGEVSEVMGKFKQAMTAVVAEADGLRGSTAMEVLGLLNPLQGVRFLAAATRLQLQARKWGLEKDLQRGRPA